MNVYTISYDLSEPQPQYESLHEAIKSLGAWWHHLQSTWIVSTSLSAKEIHDRIAQHVRANDRLLVLKVGFEWHARGDFPERAYDWLRKFVAS